MPPLPPCFPCHRPSPVSWMLAHPYSFVCPLRTAVPWGLGDAARTFLRTLSLQLLKLAGSPDLASWPPPSPGSRSHSIQHETPGNTDSIHSSLGPFCLRCRQTAACSLASSGASSADLIQSPPLSLVTSQQSTREGRRRGQGEVPECDFLELLMHWPLLK